MASSRMIQVREMVEESIWKAYDDKRMTRHEVAEELHHLYGVSQWAQHLAKRRNLVPDIACIIGLMHDIGRIEKDWDGERHVLEGAKLAKKMLARMDIFSETELKIIKKAIKTHNRKSEVEQASYAELVKDADLLSRYYENPAKRLGASKQWRLEQLLRELSQMENFETDTWSLKKFIPKWVKTR